jgi:hypothetical protein
MTRSRQRPVLLAILLALAVGWGVRLVAQNAAAWVPVQQIATRLDASARCDSATGVGATGTLTLQNPGPGLSDYITSLVVTMEATGTIAAANPIPITSTNIAGTSPTFGSISLVGGTVGYDTGPLPMYFPTPIKANSNTAPTFVVGTVANGTSRLTACYYFAQ